MSKKNETIKVFSLPCPSGVEALAGRFISNEFRRHIHKTFIIGTVEQGTRIITFADGAVTVSENELFIINPGQVHSCSSESLSGHSYKILSVAPETMRSIACQISEKHENIPFFPENHYANADVSDTFLKLFDTVEEPESEIQVESAVYEFLSSLLMSHSEFPPEINAAGEQKDAIKNACDHIRRNYMENISLGSLAAIACLSPFHFQREFKKHMGITPHEYLSDYRIGESKKMLLKSGNIADIAVKTGFFDQSHFSRTFRKTVGITPGNYHKTNRSHP